MQKEFSAIEYSCHLGGSEAIVNFICEARVNVFRREAKGAYAKKCSATEFFFIKRQNLHLGVLCNLGGSEETTTCEAKSILFKRGAKQSLCKGSVVSQSILATWERNWRRQSTLFSARSKSQTMQRECSVIEYSCQNGYCFLKTKNLSVSYIIYTYIVKLCLQK